MIRASPRRLAAVLAAVLAAAAALVAGPAGAAPAWRTKVPDGALPVNYRIDAELRTIEGEDFPRQIRGKEHIVWRNLSRDRVGELWFHLYQNAFEHADTVFLRERRREGRDVPDAMLWGGTEIGQILLLDSPGRQPTMDWIPGEDAPADRTVLRVKLPQAIEPGDSVKLVVPFTTKLPKPVSRSGAIRDFVFAGQWYPKLGRYVGRDAEGVPNVRDGWYCPHHHDRAEFAADFADYDVTLTVPAAWTVGATGAPAGEASADAAAGTRTQTWQARSVVDFAWTASPRFVERRVTVDPDGPDAPARVADEIRWVRSLLDLPAEDADLPPVEVVLLLQPEHADLADRHLEAARVALGLFGTWLGPYPWPRLTIVDAAHGADGVGGMEYPTLVTTGAAIGTPAAARQVEHVVVHETGHQWFMNLLASNKTEEAWLDEATTTWFTARAMDVAWGPRVPATEVLGIHFLHAPFVEFRGLTARWPELAGLPAWLVPPQIEAFRLWRDGPTLLAGEGIGVRTDAGPLPGARRKWAGAAGWDELVRTSWEYRSRQSYFANSYDRGALLLESLARHVRARFDTPEDREGERRVVRAFREYARQHRFSHPATSDLVRVLREVTRLPELPQLFESLARSTGALDYAVESVRTVPGAAGAPPVTEIDVRRRGDVVVPVTLRVLVEGAEAPADLAWDGAARWHRFRVPGRAASAEIDPGRLFPQDADLSNNVWTNRRSLRPAAKWGAHTLLWLENALAGWGRFF